MPGSDLDKLAKDLKKLGKQISDKELREKALIPAANELSNKLKAASPATFIRASIGVISNPSKYPLSVAVGLKYSTGSEAANLAYAFEYGTVERYHKSGKYTGFMKPAPFFRPTVDANRNQIVTMVISAIGKIVENKLK
jgi:HK97 gp10 family phage protein